MALQTDIASFNNGDTEIGYITSISPKLDGKEIDVSVITDEWDKTIPGTRSFEIDLELIFDESDANVALLRTNWWNRTAMPNLRLYIDGTNCTYADTVTDSEATVYITKYNWKPLERNDIIKIAVTVKYYGPVAYGVPA